LLVCAVRHSTVVSGASTRLRVAALGCTRYGSGEIGAMDENGGQQQPLAPGLPAAQDTMPQARHATSVMEQARARPPGRMLAEGCLREPRHGRRRIGRQADARPGAWRPRETAPGSRPACARPGLWQWARDPAQRARHHARQVAPAGSPHWGPLARPASDADARRETGHWGRGVAEREREPRGAGAWARHAGRPRTHTARGRSLPGRGQCITCCTWRSCAPSVPPPPSRRPRPSVFPQSGIWNPVCVTTMTDSAAAEVGMEKGDDVCRV